MPSLQLTTVGNFLSCSSPCCSFCLPLPLPSAPAPAPVLLLFLTPSSEKKQIYCVSNAIC